MRRFGKQLNLALKNQGSCLFKIESNEPGKLCLMIPEGSEGR